MMQNLILVTLVLLVSYAKSQPAKYAATLTSSTQPSESGTIAWANYNTYILVITLKTRTNEFILDVFDNSKNASNIAKVCIGNAFNLGEYVNTPTIREEKISGYQYPRYILSNLNVLDGNPGDAASKYQMSLRVTQFLTAPMAADNATDFALLLNFVNIILVSVKSYQSTYDTTRQSSSSATPTATYTGPTTVRKSEPFTLIWTIFNPTMFNMRIDATADPDLISLQKMELHAEQGLVCKYGAAQMEGPVFYGAPISSTEEIASGYFLSQSGLVSAYMKDSQTTAADSSVKVVLYGQVTDTAIVNRTSLVMVTMGSHAHSKSLEIADKLVVGTTPAVPTMQTAMYPPGATVNVGASGTVLVNLTFSAQSNGRYAINLVAPANTLEINRVSVLSLASTLTSQLSPGIVLFSKYVIAPETLLRNEAIASLGTIRADSSNGILSLLVDVTVVDNSANTNGVSQNLIVKVLGNDQLLLTQSQSIVVAQTIPNPRPILPDQFTPVVTMQKVTQLVLNSYPKIVMDIIWKPKYVYRNVLVSFIFIPSGSVSLNFDTPRVIASGRAIQTDLGLRHLTTSGTNFASITFRDIYLENASTELHSSTSISVTTVTNPADTTNLEGQLGQLITEISFEVASQVIIFNAFTISYANSASTGVQLSLTGSVASNMKGGSSEQALLKVYVPRGSNSSISLYQSLTVNPPGAVLACEPKLLVAGKNLGGFVTSTGYNFFIIPAVKNFASAHANAARMETEDSIVIKQKFLALDSSASLAGITYTLNSQQSISFSVPITPSSAFKSVSGLSNC
ncbi:hypothetical protein Ciccas_000171 [Cichlidogyrus casuarinus]|uniref:Uncharacterized protein n=1 Tax=Cichlidogyrus casuarinus TaxID=1844966 RepID=A0ABD2QNN6_9PLAT